LLKGFPIVKNFGVGEGLGVDVKVVSLSLTVLELHSAGEVLDCVHGGSEPKNYEFHYLFYF
jgi:hypothetical protein